jgi:radical SAM protein with 4Fe4S-binding SPASM domain
MCPRQKMTRPVGMMDIELVKKIAAEAAGKTKDCYIHMFGENFFHLQLFEIIDVLADAGIEVSMSTNATQLTSDNIRKILTSKLHRLTVSADSMVPKVYETIRAGAKFEEVKRNIGNLIAFAGQLESAVELDIQMVVMHMNAGEVEAFKKYYNDELYSVSGSFVTIKPFDNFAGQIQNLSNSVPPTRTWKLCTNPNYSMSIHWNGDVVSCCYDYDSKNLMGSLTQSTIEEVWNGDRYRSLRKAHAEQKFDGWDMCRICMESSIYEEHKADT